ncbi:TonB-dependent receptor [Beijerinckia indica]|uniref:TonB-dependent siderophore receptor n=1 Tax=Beijerinckia indica subsp. indica (strain ATCC 9039 / DSM 1715 / NCIMB 8712) TaxID=395963 RepID=B2ICK5_BEII9|nr:TonB-dependent siderophore receptor [Beijerinckia indica]ACB93894.1 TonB-dependent siderophore receptor [Beijerinckia indica subsp. indica ATCC 9039]
MKRDEFEIFEGSAANTPATELYIKAKARPPLKNAVVGLASLMLGGGAATAQESTNLALEQIEVEAGNASNNGSAYNPRSTGLDRLPEPILDTAQSINVIPQQLLRDQQTTTMVEALRNVPGISINSAEGGTQGDNINIRGFSARNDIYRDGIREPAWYSRDSFSVENIDVYKGPSSFIFGRGSTGGVINVVSKLPVFTNFTDFSLSGNTAPGVRSTIDVNRTFGDIAARIIILGTDWDTAGRNFIGTKRVGAAPSIAFRFTEQTKLTLSYIYQHDDNVPDYGIPIVPGSIFGTSYGKPAPVSRGTYYGQQTPGFNDTEKVDAHIVTAKLEHEFNKDWMLTNGTRFSNVDRFLRARAPQWVASTSAIYAQPVGGTALTSLAGVPIGSLYSIDNNHFQNHTINSMISNLTNVVGHEETWGLKHTIQMGLDLSKEDRYNARQATNNTTAATTNQRINLLYPDPYPFGNNFGPNTTLTRTEARDIGMYVSDQVKFNDYFELKGGFRYDFYKAWQFTANSSRADGSLSQNGTTPFNLSSTNNFASWNGSALFHPAPNATLYYSFGTSVNPLAEYTTITNGGQNLGATTNESHEVGAKIDLFDSRLSLTGAAFMITQNNAVETIDATTSPPTVALVGKTRVKGIEVGATGEVTPGWNVFAGYTYLDGRLLQSQQYANFVGNVVQNVPRNQASFSTTYQVTPDWKIGTSVYFVDSRWTNVQHAGWVPSYWRWDLMTSYQVTENFSLQANLFNVLNTTNYESIAGAGFAVPGVGRSLQLTARLHW